MTQYRARHFSHLLSWVTTCGFSFGIGLGLVSTLVSNLNAAGPVDPFGQLDVVTIERTVVQQTSTNPQQVSVRVLLKNDEQLSSVSVPLKYDPLKLSLTAIDYTNSRASHIATRIVSPNPVATAQGHFVVAIIRIQENAIQPGDGLLFTAHFTLNEALQPGDSTRIDTLFFPPGGELVLAEAGTSSTIRPAFVAGSVVLASANRLPQISAMGDVSILEGEELSLELSASDPDSDPLTYTATAKPTGAILTDNANGTARLRWTPDYTGPNSSNGSPFSVTVKVSDGKSSSFESFGLTVINRNRLPQITAPASLSVSAGLPVSFSLNGSDPDFETITFSASDLPVGSSLDPVTGEFSWETDVADSGVYLINVVGKDIQGGADTVVTTLTVEQTLVYQLSLDSIDVELGGTFTLPVTLSNLMSVSGFELLIAYDPTFMFLQSVTRSGTRSESLEEFNYTNNYSGVQGQLYIRGKADLPQGEVTPPLGSGTGEIAKLNFQVGSDLAYAGLSVPVRFELQNLILNTLYDASGTALNRSEITFSNGLVSVEPIGQTNRGDINLNGLPYEIGDAIYFINFIIDPITYPFSFLQYSNSDINGDGYLATISDLVRLVNIVVRGQLAPRGSSPLPTSLATAELLYSSDLNQAMISLTSSQDVGAILLTFPHATGIDEVSLHPATAGMQLGSSRSGDTLRILIYSLEGEVINSGSTPLLALPLELSTDDLTITAASADGDEMQIALAQTAVPMSFSLDQNYPNPFNPETTIRFSLSESGPVELIIHNISGQQVQVVTSGTLEAGQHEVRWDGNDESGRAVASGIYFYRLTSRGETATRKMLLMK